MMGSTNKRFKIAAEDLRSIAEGHGAAFASDMVVVEGHRVGFMYRERPDFLEDSGWRFMSGFESDEYVSNPANFGIYDINTIANYDPDIVPLLRQPIGSEFQRDPESGVFSDVGDGHLADSPEPPN